MSDQQAFNTNVINDLSSVFLESGCSSGPSAPSASDQDQGCPDLSLLDPMTEDSLIENLYRRFKRDQIYVSSSACLNKENDNENYL